MSALWISCLAVAMEGLALGAVLPVMARYTEQLGGSPARVGWWVTWMFFIRTAPKVVANPWWGRLSDRIGRRNGLIIATCGTLGSSVIWALSTQPWHLLAGQALAGLFGAQAALAFAVASDTTAPHRRARAMGLLGATFGTAFAVGPIIGGVIGQIDPRFIGLFSGGAQCISLAVLIICLRETRPRATATSPRSVRPVRWLATHRRVAHWLVVVVSLAAAYSVMLPTLELLCHRWYGFQAWQVGMVWGGFGLAGIVAQGGLIGPLTRKFGEKQVLIAGSAALMIGMLLMTSKPVPVVFVLAVVAIGLGVGLATPALTALLSLMVGADEQGAVHGLNQGATSLGRAMGYLLGGGLAAVGGLALPYLIVSVLLMIMIGMTASLRARPA